LNLAPKSDVSSKEQLAISLVNSSNSPSVTATNLVEKLVILPYPYELIRDISLYPTTSNSAKITEIKKTDNGYDLVLSNAPATLNLYAAQDQSWVYTCDNQKSLKQTIALSWFNQFAPECNSLTLIYTPQSYQFMGYALVAAWFASRVIVHSRSNLRKLVRKLA
jgi:hypothetical protein